jgi:RNA polymerase sigma factor (sigma-70 family)
MSNAAANVVRRHLYKLVERHKDTEVTDRELLQRFAAQNDEAAFEALFRRHGAMVIAASRRVLGNSHDAEDVCQAAFLLLAKKASSQRWQASVANWLYKTSHLLALKSRTAASRRARREGSGSTRTPANPLSEITGQELLAALDEELLKLPESLCAPLVLCYLQGVTRDEAAQRLGCPLATLKNRLERGRARLHAMLNRRGLGLSTVLLGTLWAQQNVSAAPNPLIVHQTVQAALATAAGESVNGLVSANVNQLVKGGFSTMCRNRLKNLLGLLLAGGLLCTAAALVVSAMGDEQIGPAPKSALTPQEKKAESPARGQGTTLRYQFKQGDKFSYVVETAIETRTSAAGVDRFVMTSWTYDVTWRVIEITSGGDARMTLTIDRVRYVDDNGFAGKLEFDSKKHKYPVGPPAIARVLSGVLKAQIGAEFTCTVSPRGEIFAFNAPKKLTDAVRNTAGIKVLYSLESYKRKLADQGGIVLSEAAVAKDASWSTEAETPMAGGHAKMTLATKATYLGDVDRDGKQLAEIALKPSATKLERVPPSGLGPFTLKSHVGKGSMFFDNEKGRLVETEVNQTVYMESSPPGQVENIVWNTKLRQTARLVPQN